MAKRLMQRRNVRAEDLAEVGLTTPGRRGPMDRFRDRVIFPIRDATGGAVGMGGRLLPRPDETDADAGTAARDRGPKYLNSPATPLFDKSRTLYLIDKAKASIRRTGRAVIVEGYTDALMAHQAGFTDVVASLGTALTPGQISVLLRYKKDNELHIGLAYDVDPAGQSAGAFGVRELQQLIGDMQRTETGMSVGVVRLPEGRDPDEVIRDEPERWREAAARPDRDRGVPDRSRGGPARRPDRPTAGAASSTRSCRSCTACPIPSRARATSSTSPGGRASRSGVLADTLRQWRAGPTRGARTTGRGSRSRPCARRPSRSAPRRSCGRSPRSRPSCCGCCCWCPTSSRAWPTTLGPDLLPSTLARELFRAIVFGRAPDDDGLRPGFDRTAFLAGLDEEVRALAIALLARPGPDPAALPADRIRYEIENLLLDLEADRIEERIQYNLAEQADAERRGDQGQMERILNQQRAINEERRSLDRRRERLGSSRGRWPREREPLTRTRPAPVEHGRPMPDPLDKQLVEAVLARPRRGKAEQEEARLATMRPARGSGGDPGAGAGAGRRAGTSRTATTTST